MKPLLRLLFLCGMTVAPLVQADVAHEIRNINESLFVDMDRLDPRTMDSSWNCAREHSASALVAVSVVISPVGWP